jgi:hypothetical protein
MKMVLDWMDGWFFSSLGTTSGLDLPFPRFCAPSPRLINGFNHRSLSWVCLSLPLIFLLVTTFWLCLSLPLVLRPFCLDHLVIILDMPVTSSGFVSGLVPTLGCAYHSFGLVLPFGHYLWMCLKNTSFGFAPLEVGHCFWS